jgi:electron transport complex protein RnfD
VDDFTAVVSGLLLSFLLPAASPWWFVMLGAVIALTLGKTAFGGLGTNPVSTPLVGWAVLFVSFPLLIDPNAAQLATDFTDPLTRLKYFGPAAAETIPLTDLLLGRQINGLGAGQAGALLLGGSVLAARGIVRWQISLGFFLGVAGPAAFLSMLDPATNASPLFHLCTGSVLLCGFFLATETGNSPTRPLSMIIYGFSGGMLTVILRKYGVNTDAAPFAVLLLNMLTPYLDMLRPKPFGVK